MTKDKTMYEDDFFSNEDYFWPIKKDEMIYDDANSIGVDESSLNQLMNILTPRMKDQLFDELHNNEVNQWLLIN